jgi:hypothetical protein
MKVLDTFERGIVALVSIILACFAYAVFVSWRDAPVPLRPEATIIPGPVVIVERQHYRERVPNASGRPFDNGMRMSTEYFAHTPRKHRRCDAECRAYRTAYTNARIANRLLGVHRYKEHA